MGTAAQLESVHGADTFPRMIRAAAAAYGDNTAITLGDTHLSYAGLDRESAAFARVLLARGAGKGSRIGFIFGNGPEFAKIFAAIARIGAIAVPLSTMIKSNELVRVLRHSDIAGLIVQRHLLKYDLVDRICHALPDIVSIGSTVVDPRVPHLRWVVSTGDDLRAPFQAGSAFAANADLVSEDLLRAVESEVFPSDQLIEIYTSGSMSAPKGVKHLHGPVLYRANYFRRAGNVSAGQVRNAVMPMFWVGGFMMHFMVGLTAGATTVCFERTMIDSRLALGSVIAPDDLATYSDMPKPYWSLGMTETLGPYGYGDVLRAPGSAFAVPLDHVVDGCGVRVADECGRDVKDGGTGELQVRGYIVAPALHKIEQAEFYTPDGYYRTGDLATVEGSRIHFIGRDGDMIKTAGSNVSPLEVEKEIQSFPGVHSVYVVGVPDKARGQVLVAAIVPRDGETVDCEKIQTELKDRLSGYKIPRACVLISRDQVPMLPSNKVARRILADFVGKQIVING